MRSPAIPSARVSIPFAAVALGLLLLAQAPAHAGFGDLVKKAKDKATQAVVKPAQPATASPTEDVPEFDDMTVELTEARVTRLLAAYRAANAASAGRAELAATIDKASQERGALEDKFGPQMQAARAKRDDVNRCLHDAFREEQDRRAEEYSKRAMTDPALRERYMKAAAQYNARAAQGDTTAQQELMKVIMAEVGLSHADSAAILKKCGTPPPPLPAEVRAEELDRQIAAMQDDLRAKDEKSADALSKESGFDRQQYAMALDRIHIYLDWEKAKSPKAKRPPGFSDAELASLGAHAAELRSALGA